MNKYIIILSIFLFPILAYGETGTIENANKYAKICHNVSCSSYGVLNMKPTINGSTSGAEPVVIGDGSIVGHAWGNEIGWVNFDPVGGEVIIDDETGEITGKAWANVGSWINFSPTDVSGNPEVGVRINEQGEFEGFAWVSGMYGGWLKFDCTDPDACVTTDWRPGVEAAVDEEDEGGNGRSGSRASRRNPPLENGEVVIDTPPAYEAEAGVENAFDSDEDGTPDKYIDADGADGRDALILPFIPEEKEIIIPISKAFPSWPDIGVWSSVISLLFVGLGLRLLWHILAKFIFKV